MHLQKSVELYVKRKTQPKQLCYGDINKSIEMNENNISQSPEVLKSNKITTTFISITKC